MDSKDQQMTAMEKRLYDTLSEKQYFSTQKQMATAQVELAGATNELNKKLEKAATSSTAVARSLNRLTLAAVVISAVALGLEIYKLVCPSN